MPAAAINSFVHWRKMVEQIDLWDSVRLTCVAVRVQDEQVPGNPFFSVALGLEWRAGPPEILSPRPLTPEHPRLFGRQIDLPASPDVLDRAVWGPLEALNDTGKAMWPVLGDGPEIIYSTNDKLVPCPLNRRDECEWESSNGRLRLDVWSFDHHFQTHLFRAGQGLAGVLATGTPGVPPALTLGDIIRRAIPDLPEQRPYELRSVFKITASSPLRWGPVRYDGLTLEARIIREGPRIDLKQSWVGLVPEDPSLAGKWPPARLDTLPDPSTYRAFNLHGGGKLFLRYDCDPPRVLHEVSFSEQAYAGFESLLPEPARKPRKLRLARPHLALPRRSAHAQGQLTSLGLENFRSCRSVEIPLTRFSVLVGFNDAGKSSVLRALHLLGLTAEFPLSARGAKPSVRGLDASLRALVGIPEEAAGVFTGRNELSAIRTFGTSDPVRLQARGRLDDGREFSYSLAVTERGPAAVEEESLAIGDREIFHGRPGSWAPAALQPLLTEADRSGLNQLARQAHPDVTAVVRVLRATPPLLLYPPALALPWPSRRILPGGGVFPMGLGLPALVQRLVNHPDSTLRSRLTELLHKWLPSIQGFVPDFDDSGRSLFRFLVGEPPDTQIIEASQASDGALLFLAYLALVHGVDWTSGRQPGVLLIEEPENGLHPSKLPNIVNMLRELTAGTDDIPSVQVLATTHSPLLVNECDPEGVLLVHRPAGSGDTRVRPISQTREYQKMKAVYSLGELWYSEGEDRLMADDPE